MCSMVCLRPGPDNNECRASVIHNRMLLSRAQVEASRKLTLEQAPKVLTLHLKQFAFDAKLGPRKLARRVRCDTTK